MRITLNLAGKWTALQQTKINLAVEMLNRILCDKDFIQSIYDLPSPPYFSGSVVKPEKIAQLIAFDTTHTVTASVWYISWWKRFSSAVAYEGNNRVHIRSSYLENGRISDLASTLLHEWTHSVGYSHDFWPTKNRVFSVPYSVGNLVSKFAEEHNL